MLNYVSKFSLRKILRSSKKNISNIPLLMISYVDFHFSRRYRFLVKEEGMYMNLQHNHRLFAEDYIVAEEILSRPL